MFSRAKRIVVMVRLLTLSSWLPKHKGFARQYARESCYGFRVTLEVTSSIHAIINVPNGTPIVVVYSVHASKLKTWTHTRMYVSEICTLV